MDVSRTAKVDLIEAGAEQVDRRYPPKVRDFELELIEKRREAAGLGKGSPGRDALGIAISGGGIRSATFALGVFQALADKDLLRRFDYVSTVSGGGYFGSFLGSLFTRIDEIVKHASVRSPSAGQSPARLVQDVLRDSSHPVIDHLRQNGQYLAPGGSDRILFGAVLLRNWVSLMVVIGVFLLTIALGLEVGRVVLANSLQPVFPGLSVFFGAESCISPWFLLAAIALLITIPLGWAYWILDQITWWSAALGAFVATQGLVILAWARGLPWGSCAVIGVIGLLAIGVASWLTAVSRRTTNVADGSGARADGPAFEAQHRLNGDTWARHKVSEWFKKALVALAVFLFLATSDSLGRYIYGLLSGDSESIGKIWAGIWSFLLVAVPFGAKLVGIWGRKQTQGRQTLPIDLITSLAAGILLFGGWVSASVFAQSLSRDPLSDVEFTRPLPECLSHGGLAFLVMLAISCVIGWTHTLLNRSTQLPLYSARITRAYLGASNPSRYVAVSATGSKPHPSAATSPREGDDVPATDYFGWKRGKMKTPWENGGPLHLINTTLNETIDGRSKQHELDRKGIGLALGPHGLSLGVRHHLRLSDAPLSEPPPPGFSVFQVPSVAIEKKEDMLSLGLWASISGAAFSTGLGSMTRPAFSLLAGLTNVRLGRWWYAPGTRHPRARGWSVFLVQRYLFRELSARFRGTADPYWYLSDGGHFENMGAYELIRRRLPFIVIIDGEADPEHAFQGLANLVRKARLDFETEIEFLSEPFREFGLSEAEECPYGSLDELRPEGPQRISRKQACLAKIKYAPGNFGCDEGYLVYIKATLFPSVPADLRHYAQTNPSFPQETTIDQFFDEAQWESYRKLGHLIGTSLFGNEKAPFARLMSGPEKVPVT